MSKRRGSQHKNRDSGGTGRTAAERTLLNAVIAERMAEIGIDPSLPPSAADLEANMKAAVDDYNLRIAILSSGDIGPYRNAWNAFGQACLDVNEGAQHGAIEAMRDINPASPITSAFAVAARLTYAIEPLGEQLDERNTIRAMATGLADCLDAGHDESEVALYSRILSVARSGDSTAPVIASYGGEIVMNRLRLLIAMMMRGQVAEGRDPPEILAEVVDVATESVVEHLLIPREMRGIVVSE